MNKRASHRYTNRVAKQIVGEFLDIKKAFDSFRPQRCNWIYLQGASRGNSRPRTRQTPVAKSRNKD